MVSGEGGKWGDFEPHEGLIIGYCGLSVFEDNIIAFDAGVGAVRDAGDCVDVDRDDVGAIGFDC